MRKNVQKTTFEAAEMILGPWNQQYLGFEIYSDLMKLFLPREKILNLKQCALEIMFQVPAAIVQRIRVKIALNVVKASKLVQMKLIKIKIRLEGISKIFCFCSHANMAASDKGI